MPRNQICHMRAFEYNGTMTAEEIPTSLPEREMLRQREIEGQIACLHSPAPNTRIAAARRLGEMQAGLDALFEAGQDPQESVRGAAVMALGSFSADERLPEIIDYLLGAIDDSSEKVCQAALRSLGMLHAVSARADIEYFLKDPNPYILGSAILALARLDAYDLSETLAAFLDHESTYVQMQAARAAAILKNTTAGPKIIQLIQRTRATHLSASRSERREGDYFSLQNQLIRAAGDLRLQEAAPLLIDIAQKDIGFRGLAVESLIAIGAEIDPQMLTGLLSDPSTYLRRRLVFLMSQYNYTPALPLLRSLLADESVTVRGAALQAVTLMQDSASLPRMVWMAYHDSNPFIRVQAAQSLVQFLGGEAQPHLIRLARDSNFEVRRTACSFLIQQEPFSQAALPILAGFAQDFPEDDLTQTIAALLTSLHFDLSQPVEQTPPLPDLFPPQLRAEQSQLLDALLRWQQALPLDPAVTPGKELQETASALAYLIDLLRNLE